MKQDFAETIGMQALAWLAGHDELLPVFLGATGAGLDEIKARAGDPDLLASVLDFVCMDDAWISDFTASAGLSRDQPMMARQILSGAARDALDLSFQALGLKAHRVFAPIPAKLSVVFRGAVNRSVSQVR